MMGKKQHEKHLKSFSKLSTNKRGHSDGFIAEYEIVKSEKKKEGNKNGRYSFQKQTERV